DASVMTKRMPSRNQPRPTHALTASSIVSSVTIEISTNLYSSMLVEQLARVRRVIADDDVRAGAADAEQGLHHDAILVDPTVGRSRLDHRVLARHGVRGDRHVDLVADRADDVEVCECRLDHDDVGALGDVHVDLAQ